MFVLFLVDVVVSYFDVDLDPPPSPPHPHFRLQLLEIVRERWITDFLERQLSDISIAVTFHQQPTPCLDPPALYADDNPGPTRTTIDSLVKRCADGLLILGPSGGGKTTLLLEVLRRLLDQAEVDDKCRIPVVFHRSTWAAGHALDKWLVDELHDDYGVPYTVAKFWILNGHILPMLDSLDQLAPASRRQALVDAVNGLRQLTGTSVVITSLPESCVRLTKRLRLGSAVVIQPLLRWEVEHYIRALGDSGAALRRALDRDPELWMLLNSPLMLSIAVVAYRDALFGEADSLSADRLFAKFVDVMFRGRPQLIPRHRFMHWLRWLARAMTARQQDVLTLERLGQLLPIGGAGVVEKFRSSSIGIIFALLSGSAGLFAGGGGGISAFIRGFQAATIGGWFGWSNVALRGRTLSVFGVTLRFGEFVSVGPADRLAWSWDAARRQAPHIARSILPRVGLPFIVGPAALITMAIAGLLPSLVVAIVGPVILFYWRLLQDALVPVSDIVRAIPNEGFWRSIRSSVLAALLGGIPIGLAAGSLTLMLYGARRGMLFGMFIGLYVGFISALGKGAFFCIDHMISRVVLCTNDYGPLRYVRFLDYATQVGFMRSVGGGYIFVHRRFAEYLTGRGKA